MHVDPRHRHARRELHPSLHCANVKTVPSLPLHLMRCVSYATFSCRVNQLLERLMRRATYAAMPRQPYAKQSGKSAQVQFHASRRFKYEHNHFIHYTGSRNCNFGASFIKTRYVFLRPRIACTHSQCLRTDDGCPTSHINFST